MDETELALWHQASLELFWIAFKAKRRGEAQFFGYWYYCVGPMPVGKARRWFARCRRCGTPKVNGQLVHAECADCIIAESKRARA